MNAFLCHGARPSTAADICQSMSQRIAKGQRTSGVLQLHLHLLQPDIASLSRRTDTEGQTVHKRPGRVSFSKVATERFVERRGEQDASDGKGCEPMA